VGTFVPRRLIDALRSTPLFFEPVPPPSRAPSKRAEERAAALVRLIESFPRVDAIDIPELVDENHEGRPYYRSGDVRVFGRGLAERTGREVIVNKVVAHLESVPALEAWAEETVRAGVHHAVLVGGTSRFIPYPGPPVAEANRICEPVFKKAEGLIGNVAIPQRTGEAHRMLAKTRAGSVFFTTQLVFSATAAIEMLSQYDRLCRQAGILPATVLLSFATVTDEYDVEFARWLGADIPEEVERTILIGEATGDGARSVGHALDVWGSVTEAVRSGELHVPLGVNVEQISTRHLEPARMLVREFAEALGDA
jgi:5,10-methylenetetrahydrofolate reductase